MRRVYGGETAALLIKVTIGHVTRYKRRGGKGQSEERRRKARDKGWKGVMSLFSTSLGRCVQMCL